MTLLDKAALLVTGLIALYLLWYFWRDLKSGTRATGPAAAYMTGFGVLLVAGLLLIGFGYGVLEHRLVVVVASLIPVSLSLGLVMEFLPGYTKGYGTFALVGLLALAVTRMTGPAGLATVTLVIVHAIAGLIIFALPFYMAFGERAPRPFAWVGVGGGLIGIGGVALAFLKAGMPILPASFIFAILAPLLLLMTASFAWGFVAGSATAAPKSPAS